MAQSSKRSAQDPVLVLNSFIWQRVTVHLRSGSNIIGHLIAISSDKDLIFNEALEERIDGSTSVVGKHVVSHTNIRRVCLFSSCKCNPKFGNLQTKKLG